MNNDELKAEIKDNSRLINVAINLIEEINEARERNKMNTTKETDERIEYALSYIRYAIRITDDMAVVEQLRGAEHHLTRGV